MRTEEQVLALFEEANRVPDPLDLDSTVLAGHLAIIEQRSSGMTQLNEKRAAETPPSRRRTWGLVLAAAITVAAVVGIGIVVANNGETEVPPATQPVTPPEGADTTVAASEPEPTTVTTAPANPSPTEPIAVSSGSIMGLWGKANTGVMRIESKGTLQVAAVPRGTTADDFDERAAESGFYASGAWSLDSDVLTFTSDGESVWCDVGEVTTMTLEFQSGGHLVISEVDDPCWPEDTDPHRFAGIWLPVS